MDRAANALISLDDKYTVKTGRVFLTGTQALARLPMIQRERDLAAGLNTAGFVSGYRGSPLGGLDQTLWKAQKHLAEHHIVFEPGVNEDLAATAVWGSQQVNLFPGAKYDGVFAMWYGKGPGVDRCGDVLRHANAAGTSRHGGVLVVAGDDHAAKSSTLPHQTDHIFKAVMMPVLAPSGVQDYVDLGLHGWAMSRYSGCWVAFKCVSDTVESAASVDIDPQRVQVVIPADFDLPPGGLNIRWPDPPLQQEERLLQHKLYAALAYCRANGLNRVVMDSPEPRLGIITCGKSYLDVRQALDDLGIDEALAAEIGIRLYKCGMVWPLESEGVRQFAEGLDEILVVEEKRPFLEYQLKEELYNWREDVRPRVIGKFDEKGEWAFNVTDRGKVWHGDWLLPAAGELTPAMIARVIAARIDRFFTSPRIKSRLAFLQAKERALTGAVIPIERKPWFCPGCPHNTSTVVPEGSRATAGIGCHYMAIWMDRSTATFTQMGGEGVPWIGQAPFTETKHIFANLGDGTYFHSGILAIRAAVAARVPITYKLLYNDAVAMTGGQAVDGQLSVPMLTRQLAAEGVEKIVIVSEDPDKYAQGNATASVVDSPETIQSSSPRRRGPSGRWIPAFAGMTVSSIFGRRANNRTGEPGVPVRHRNELDAVQRELREYPGVSVLIYDQTCAAEKRRRRKRGTYPDPQERLFINDLVCEGCGDCGVQSNCLAVEPLETEFGRKRQINQSACNKDFSCLKGICPSFVTVSGGKLRRGKGMAADETTFPALPERVLPDVASPYGIMVTGVGGTGVVTVGALIGMAAHIDGLGVTTLDMTGLAQKGGAVMSHIRVARDPESLHAVRIAAGEARAVIGCDLVVTASQDALAKMAEGRTRAVVNCAETPTADFTSQPNWQWPENRMEQAIRQTVGTGTSAGTTDADSVNFIDATRLATTLMGDAIATNLFLLGYAWQKGLLPITLAAFDRAIELNAVAVDANRRAFLWGRRAAHYPAAVAALLRPAADTAAAQPDGIDALVQRRETTLRDYQNDALAQRYRALVERVRNAETAVAPRHTALTEAVAQSYFKLLAIKDEYEVARLLTDQAFQAKLDAAFEGQYTLSYHLSPPSFARTDPATGRPAKLTLGPWMRHPLRLLASLRRIRGTWLDPFRHSEDRRLERRLIADFEADVERLLDGLTADRLATATAIASLPLEIRGYGPIKAAAAQAAAERHQVLWQKIQSPKAGNSATVVQATSSLAA